MAEPPETVIILKTHLWNPNIEWHALRILEGAKNLGFDFYVLMHDNQNNLNQTVESEELRSHIISFSTEDIQQLYPSGFIDMWLSNHWILMWFFQKFDYHYYWCLEYDVWISGDPKKILGINSDEDFIYVRENEVRYNVFDKFSVGNHWEKIQENRIGYLQIARYSRRALAYLNHLFQEGNNGQDETTIFSFLFNAVMKTNATVLGSRVRGTWTWGDHYSYPNYRLFRYHDSIGMTSIFHPIKF